MSFGTGQKSNPLTHVQIVTCMMRAWLPGNSAQRFRKSFSASVRTPRSGRGGMGVALAEGKSRMEAMVSISSPVITLLHNHEKYEYC